MKHINLQTNVDIRKIIQSKTLFIILVLSLISAKGKLYAQLENIPLITVTGESVIKVLPDYCILGIRVEKDIPRDSRGEAKGFDIFEDEDTRLSLFDVNDNDIVETIIQISENTLAKEVFVTFHDLNKLDKYLINLAKSGFDKYIFVDYRLNNYELLKDEARAKAIQSAKDKAGKLAAALGQSIGSAHIIEEVEYKSYNMLNIDKYSNLENITHDLDADKYLIEPGFITITAKIQVSFDLRK